MKTQIDIIVLGTGSPSGFVVFDNYLIKGQLMLPDKLHSLPDLLHRSNLGKVFPIYINVEGIQGFQGKICKDFHCFKDNSIRVKS